jgi:riboflavin synthase
VAGHVDGVGRILDVRTDGASRRFTVEAPTELAAYLATKGSVALDGISLTVNEVAQSRFGINIVPHTLTHTTLGAKKPGDRVNLEVDVFARYVVRAMELRT